MMNVRAVFVILAAAVLVFPACAAEDDAPEGTADAVAGMAGMEGAEGMAGMVARDLARDRRIEHLKGYVDDRTLRIAEGDWAAATRDANVWNTPTLYTQRTFWGREEAEAWLRTEEARYVPALLKAEWLEGLPPGVPQVARDLARDQRIVMRRLVPVTHRFLAGTDAGGG